jgi:hypothetical protein
MAPVYGTIEHPRRLRLRSCGLLVSGLLVSGLLVSGLLVSGLLVMYGPPLRCKRKMTVVVWSAQMYPAFL